MAEDDLGEAGAQAAMVVDAGKAKIGKRELGESGHGRRDIELTGGDLRQQFRKGCFVHGLKP